MLKPPWYCGATSCLSPHLQLWVLPNRQTSNLQPLDTREKLDNSLKKRFWILGRMLRIDWISQNYRTIWTSTKERLIILKATGQTRRPRTKMLPWRQWDTFRARHVPPDQARRDSALTAIWLWVLRRGSGLALLTQTILIGRMRTIIW